jgi:hypothetical protein
MKKTLLIILLALTGSYGKIYAQIPVVVLNDKAGWHKLGERHIDFTKDRDEIIVMGADRFSAIKFNITEASIDLQKFEIYYAGGDKQVIEVGSPVKAGSESQVFSLKSSEIEIQKIVFVYKTLTNPKATKAQIAIWGLKTNATTVKTENSNTGKSVVPSPSVMISDKAGWHKIGERHVDFVKDRDELLVMGADRFSAIKFKVTEASIELIDLEVYYESGDKQDIQVRSPLKAGMESRVIDLNGGERSLKRIVFVYKTLPNQKDEKANVEIWGLKTAVN